ncbi:immunoglobulin-like domain-containing protein [Rubrivirga sp.]|uniref:immunoglobulin-like domain-containing protein n=1 Tax=Rubrivirga sp. TaxID=1885344 RepID=UPI003C73846C
MRTLPLVLLLGLAACDAVETFPPEPGVALEGVSLATDRDSYNNRSTVGLTLRNGGEDRIETGGLGCARLERRNSSGWSRRDFFPRVCLDILLSLSPGNQFEVDIELGLVGGVPGGTYRFVQRTSVGDVATPSFEVR